MEGLATVLRKVPRFEKRNNKAVGEYEICLRYPALNSHDDESESECEIWNETNIAAVKCKLVAFSE